MKRNLLSIIVLIAFLRPYAQEKLRVGVELDALPYVTGGYFGAVWAGKDHMRVRILHASVHMPDFIIPKGFSDNHIRAYAILADYFFNDEQNGFWLGSGVVLWNGTIREKQQLGETDYQSILINGSLGYIWDVSSRVYFSPWAGMSLRVGGSENIEVASRLYHPPILNPEASVKLGYRF